ncbi:MAG: GNAT family protein [Chloroflexota bacterium]
MTRMMKPTVTRRAAARTIMISGEKVVLRAKDLSDAHDDYRWQTDLELAHLDAAPVPRVSYAQYLLAYAYQLRISSPEHRIFAVDTPDGKHIGNCTYYNVDRRKQEAEVGLMIGERSYWDRGYGTDVIKTLVRHVFSRTKLQRLYLKTLDTNHRAQNCFTRCGFTAFGRSNHDGYNFVLMELPRQKWQIQHDRKKPSRAVARP